MTDLIERLNEHYEDCRTGARVRKAYETLCHERGLAAAEITRLQGEVERLRAALNTPEVADFAKGLVLEAAHQRSRWGSEHDAGKTPLDWFWLIGYLAQKAAEAEIAGRTEKALHHTISTAAALANWHMAITGNDNSMRPGLDAARQALGADHDQI